ncbi:MAG TPA: DUF481 domain-containing protein [Vicinamibacterales bacterium]
MPVIAVLAIAVVGGLHSTAFAQDVVQVKNGDRIKGDVVELERGDLEFSTVAAGTIEITWSEVVRLSSIQMLDIELSSGMRYTGTVSSPEDGQLVIQTASGPTMPIPLSDIAHIRVVGATFFERTTGEVDFGLTWTKSSTTYSFDGSATNRTRSYETELTIDSWLSDQDDGVTEKRNNIELDFRRLLSRRWYAMGMGHFQQDDELELDWRTVIGGGAGRWLIDTGSTELSVEGGLDYNSERYTSADDTDHSAEVFGGVDWLWTRAPTEVDADARIELSLDRSRVRLEFEGKVRRDIFRDLYWSVRAFDDFDSDPPADRPRSTFGLAIGVGWSF